MSATPTLASLVDRIIQTALARLFVARPARVESYDASKQTATVTPLLKEVIEGEDRSKTVEMAKVENVPIAWPRAGDWFLTAPITSGDYVLLVCSDRSIDRWQERGGDVDPVDRRRHSITDAIAIPGVYPKPDALTESGIDASMVLGEQGGSTIHIKTGGEIHIGSENADDFVSLSTETQANDDGLLQLIQDLATAINGWTPVPNDGGAALKTALSGWITSAGTATNDDVAASKVKAD